MAYEEALRSISLEADSSVGVYTGVPGLPGSADPNAGKQYCFVKLTGAKTVGLCTAATNELPIGVLQNKPQATGAAATVGIHGVTKAICGAAVNAGDALKLDSSGRVITATLGTDAALYVGVCITSTTAINQVATVLLKIS
jgi:hypothetical protein